jgi:hypothetical protein
MSSLLLLDQEVTTERHDFEGLEAPETVSPASSFGTICDQMAHRRGLHSELDRIRKEETNKTGKNRLDTNWEEDVRLAHLKI